MVPAVLIFPALPPTARQAVSRLRIARGWRPKGPASSSQNGTGGQSRWNQRFLVVAERRA